MGADTVADRLAAAREALRTAPGPGESLPAIAEMIDVSAELQSAGDDGALLARELINESIGQLSAAVAELPADGEDQLIARYLLAEAGLLRAEGPGPDLDDAIGYLRQLRAQLPGGTPDAAEVDAELGRALLTRAAVPGGQLADLDEAGKWLESGLDGLAPDSPDRRATAAGVAVQRACRYGLFGGTQADREAAAAFARVCLSSADGGAEDAEDDVAGLAHLVMAWMALTRRLTVSQRSTTLAMGGDIEALRSDPHAAATLLREMGDYEIAGADAETAIGHLRQVPEASGAAALDELVPWLWTTALLATARSGTSLRSADLVDDARRIADQIGDLADAIGPDDPEHGEWLAMRAALLAAGTTGEPGAGTGLAPAADALGAAAAGLPAEHLLRSPILDLLGHAFGRQVAGAAASDDVAARLGELADAMARAPRDDPAFARAMTSVGMQMLGVGSTNRSMLEQDWLAPRLEQLTSGLAPGDPVQPLAQYMHLSARLAPAIMQHRTDIADSVIGELTRCTESAPLEYPVRPYMLAGLGVAYMERHTMGGELRHLEQAERYMARAFEEAAPDGPFAEAGRLRGILHYFRGHLTLMWSYYEPSVDRLSAAITDLERAAHAQELPPPFALSITSELDAARTMRESLLIDAGQPASMGPKARAALDGMVAAADQVGRDNPHYPSIVAQAAAGLFMLGVADHDTRPMDRAIRMLAEAAQTQGLAVRERPRLLEAHGLGLLTRYGMTRRPSDLSNAIDRLEEARRSVEQETGSPYMGTVLQTLASAYRTRGSAARGDADRAATLGLAALREHAGDVFLQDSDENALHIARRGISDATEMARWFLDRGRGETAISALELGRGMVLHAATSGAGVAQALREAGHPELAREWDGQPLPGAEPNREDDLRYRVMLAIEQSPAEARLLSPPAVQEIAAALTATGTDALAYLLPRDDAGPGLAIIVSPDGTVRPLPLTGLHSSGASPVSAFLQARRAVEAAELGEATAAARQAWLPVLGGLCGWAWREAMGRLLDAVPARGPRADRRIVLVPVAELGLVPWHAAREPASGRYACQQAVFSYAASARQFVESARWRPRPWAQDPVLISDAAPSLYLTAAGLGYLQGAYYPAAAVFGYARHRLPGTVPGAAGATRDDVLGALPRPGRPGASLLHFGCHGRVQIPALGSSLNLGLDGTGQPATVEVRDILRQARSGPGDQDGTSGGGLVVLASCLTDVTEHDFDEALTLASAFLSAGCSGVVAARWAVGGAETALFMNVFHQMLTGGQPPAGALRAAQLWMLAPDREVPAGWPKVLREEAALAGSPSGPDLAGPEAWAGFTYQGR